MKTRTDDLDNLVLYAMEELGENDLDALFINAETAPFNEIRLTTWEEAIRRRYVQNEAWQTYQFAKNGWLRGVELLKLTQDQTFSDKLSKLSATLRRYVTPRPQHEQMVDIFKIASDSQLERSFIYNVLSTKLINTTYSLANGAYLDPDDQNKHIVIIPIDYGLRPLPR